MKDYATPLFVFQKYSKYYLPFMFYVVDLCMLDGTTKPTQNFARFSRDGTI